MKRLARRALLALPLLTPALSPALAGDWDPDNARILGDPSFLPLAGEVEGSFSYTYQNDRYDTQSINRAAAGLPPSSFRRDDNNFLPTLSFGITDDISVFANLGFGNARNQEDYYYNRFVLGTPIHTVRTKAEANFHALGADNRGIRRHLARHRPAQCTGQRRSYRLVFARYLPGPRLEPGDDRQRGLGRAIRHGGSVSPIWG